MTLGHSRDSFVGLVGSMDLVTFWACHRAVKPPQPILVPLEVCSQLKNEFNTRRTPRVTNRLRLGPVHARKIRCNNKESLFRALGLLVSDGVWAVV